MGGMNVPMMASLKLSDFIVNTVTGDLTDELARTRARDTEGPSVAWLLGHLLYYRYVMMGLLGHQQENPYERFKDDVTDRHDYPSIGDLVAQWNATSEKLTPAFDTATDEQMTAPMPGDGAHGEKKVLDMLVFFVWHEAYHMGQIGALRTHMGLTPTADLAMAAQSAG